MSDRPRDIRKGRGARGGSIIALYKAYKVCWSIRQYLMPASSRQCARSSAAADLEQLWESLKNKTSHHSPRPAGRRPAGRKKKKDGPLSLLPPDIWQALQELLTPVALLHLGAPPTTVNLSACRHVANAACLAAHTSSHIRAMLCTDSAKFWAFIFRSFWSVLASDDQLCWHALHGRQVDVVKCNARLLCSREVRATCHFGVCLARDIRNQVTLPAPRCCCLLVPQFKAALRVHYVTSNMSSKRVPTFERCDANTGHPAVYGTKRPLSVCLLLDTSGEILGLGVFVTVRMCNGGETQDLRNYIVIKRGQELASATTRGPPRRQSGRTSPPPAAQPCSQRAAQRYRFRICGEHSDLLQSLRAGTLRTAVVAKESCLMLDPLKHCVGHAMAQIDPTGLTSRQIAVLHYTQRAILNRNRGRRRRRIL